MRQRVICIEPLTENLEGLINTFSFVLPGETYHVKDVKPYCNKVFFILWEKGPYVSFNADAFLVCSDLDETLLINHPINKKK
jgi:hypothetical protein